MVRSLQDRLAALSRSVGRAAAQEQPAESLVEPYRVEPVVQHALEVLGFKSIETPSGPVYRRDLRYDSLTIHGQSRFTDLRHTDLSALAKTAKVEGPVRPERMRFYDTETTGLGTGAGTFPFLHAVGQLEDDEWVVYQYFLDDYGQEAALLRILWETHFSHPDTVIVTYNGKSFDWPLLKTRLVMHRMAESAGQAHIDLVHPSRRLWKRKLPNVSLNQVEASLLKLVRVADLPGKEAPARYFAYMNDGDHTHIEPVLAHNATDVCSLATLTCLIADIISGKREVDSSSEWVALGQWYDEWRAFDLADRCYAEANHCPDADWKSHWVSALYHKRRGQWKDAVRLWTAMVDLYPWSIQPLVELAKYAEHHERDYVAAERWTELAIRRSESAGERLTDPLRTRLKRIQSKRRSAAESPKRFEAFP